MKSLELFHNLAIAIVAILVVGCNEANPKDNLPDISGKAGEIAIISTKAHWEAEPGNSIRTVLAAEFPYIPQREPLYRLFNVPFENFTQIFKVHRNLLHVNINDTCTLGMRVAHDIWAKPQTMLILSAPDEISASEFILSNGDKICKVFEEAERQRVINGAKQYCNTKLCSLVEQNYGGTPYFPFNYSLKKQNGNFIWISYETSFTNQGIFIYKVPYTGEEQFTPEYLTALRDAVLKENVPATSEGSYMITNPNLIPGFFKKTIGGRDIAEVRSLWDTHNDFMGGPFISDAFLSPDGKDIIIAEGFVYAPKYAKRDYLRQLEAILYSWHWEKK
ncbi:MAG: DUF4837 family protein [Bacteroidales bacterium]|nr:DUF4837 family protein [Candidatus Cacconaster merdequi]